MISLRSLSCGAVMLFAVVAPPSIHAGEVNTPGEKSAFYVTVSVAVPIALSVGAVGSTLSGPYFASQAIRDRSGNKRAGTVAPMRVEAVETLPDGARQVRLQDRNRPTTRRCCAGRHGRMTRPRASMLARWCRSSPRPRAAAGSCMHRKVNHWLFCQPMKQRHPIAAIPGDAKAVPTPVGRYGNRCCGRGEGLRLPSQCCACWRTGPAVPACG